MSLMWFVGCAANSPHNGRTITDDGSPRRLPQAGPPSLSKARFLKRFFDVVVSATGLILLGPALFLAALLVKLTSPGPALFKQVRVGREFVPFQILKFRTMVHNATDRGPAITVGNDVRITRVGRFLRKTKLDEFPQLINVLKGEMSLVGPRPEVPRYVEMFRDEYAEVLTVRPGITDLASLQFRNESELLAEADDPEAEYCQRVLPEKLRLAHEYIKHSSLCFDLKVILRTIIAIVFRRPTATTGKQP